MLERLAQEQPPPDPPSAPHVDVHIDLSGLANLIWQSFIDHIGDVGGVAWAGIRDHLSEIAAAIWTPLSGWLQEGLRAAAEETWNGMFSSVPLLFNAIPADLSYNLPAYRAIAANPVPVAAGGVTLALVLLGLRTIIGAIVGRDHVITHISGRIIPAAFLAAAFPVLVVRGIELVNQAASGVALQGLGGLLAFHASPNLALALPYAVIWGFMIWYAIKLLIRLAYGVFRLVVAMVFAPVAIILWAIPQTEWITQLWVRELVGWGTSPLLVVVCLAVAIPLAVGQAGFLGAAAFGIAGLQAARDLVGLFSSARGGGGGGVGGALSYVRMAAAVATGGGAGVVAASAPAMGAARFADTYGCD